PTLAAQHLLGRRAPRRPAPAVTLPPPSAQPRSTLDFARDVRSSKGEIVLGLTIGLGVSLLLAGLGQAYLRGDVVAEDQSASSPLESVTLSARPEASGAAAEARGYGASAGVVAARASESASVAAGPQRAPRAAGEAPAALAATVAGRDSGLLAHASPARHAEPAVLPRATPARATRPVSLAPATPTRAHRSEPSAVSGVELDDAPAASPAAARAAAAAASPAAAASAAAPASVRAPASAAPLTPAQSAGLGLDLPL
ncbi:MAG TPA: hypothetical protein VMG12_21065, partial [Polyangiaceae bacterium]|nr:hypothetical protein [Polyangiaceae bacterium]